MADVIAFKFVNGKRMTRAFNVVAWKALGKNKQGWTEDTGDVELKSEVPVVEKKNQAAKVVVEDNPVVIAPVADDGVPGIEPTTVVSEPEAEASPDVPKPDAKPKAKRPQTKGKGKR
jgi:hypothetical protein